MSSETHTAKICSVTKTLFNKVIMIKRKTRQTSSPKLRKGSVVDVFCGVGALTHGFIVEGMTVKAGIDIDEQCRFAYESNNDTRFVNWDVAGLTGKMVNSLFDENEPRILIGCAPCQPFSIYSRKKGSSNPCWKLLEHFGRVVTESLPDIVSMENVPSVCDYQKGALFSNFISSLKSSGYYVNWKVVNCWEYGVPQLRRRMVMLASLHGEVGLEQPTRKSPMTVRQAIGKLPPINAGEAHPDDPLHRSRALSELNLRRIRQSRPGGTWEDWEPGLVAACHKKASGSWYKSVYGRMSWDVPAPTLTTQCYGYGNGRFGHPEQDRAISLREAALIQTFPHYYKLHEAGTKPNIQSIGRLIGNAVPVELSRAIARSVSKHTAEAIR